VYFDGGSEASLCCNLRDRWKILRTALVSQNNLKHIGTRADTTQAASIESESLCCMCLGGAQGPIRKNRSNRLKTVPDRCKLSGLSPAAIFYSFDRKYISTEQSAATQQQSTN